MTRVPPPLLPEIRPAGVLEGDLALGELLARRRAANQAGPAEAWQRAYLDHRRRMRAENTRYAAECTDLRERYGPPAGAALGSRMSWPHEAWHQASLDDLVPGDQAAFSSPSGEWFDKDAADFLPPCEMES